MTNDTRRTQRITSTIKQEIRKQVEAICGERRFIEVGLRESTVDCLDSGEGPFAGLDSMNSLLWVDDADLTDLVPLTEAREMDVAIGPLEEIVTELDLYCYTYADRSGWGRQLDRNLTARIEWSTRPGRWLEIHVFRETDRDRLNIPFWGV